MSLEEKSADAAAAENDDGGEESSAIAAGIRRDVKPWLNLVDDLSNLTRDAEISVPQVGGVQRSGICLMFGCLGVFVVSTHTHGEQAGKARSGNQP